MKRPYIGEPDPPDESDPAYKEEMFETFMATTGYSIDETQKNDISDTGPWLFSFKGREASEHEEPIRCDGGESGKDPAGKLGAAK
jgi:hypothetical protein